MAYPAAVSLRNTVKHITESPRISFRSENCRYLLLRTFKALAYLVDALWTNDKERRNIICASEMVMGLEVELRTAAFSMEDSIETQLYTQILSQSERYPIPPVFEIDLREIRDHLENFISIAEKMDAAYREEDHEAVNPPPIYFDGGHPSKVVGFTDLFEKIKHVLLCTPHYRDLSICGVAGIGKTTMVKKILEDPQIKKAFTRRIFVPVGLESKVNCEFQFKRILRAILAQVEPDSDATLMDEVENLDESFWARLNDGKTLIVLDDIWRNELWDRLRIIIPNKHDGCKMVFTTRLEEITFGRRNHYNLNVRFMNKEESWDLLRWRVFGEEASIPEELEKAGKKIAENCEGLPLLLIAVADLLSSAERTPEFWSIVAADKENRIFVDAYEQISEVLLPSYYNLHLVHKSCFLYLRVFPQDHQFRCSRLIKEFLFKFSDEKISETVESYFDTLTEDNVTLVNRESKSKLHGVKIYSLHSGFWHLCRKQAEDIKVLHTFNRYADASAVCIEGQRCLAIYKNVLLGIKHVYNSVASVPNARSLLCTGAYHQYQVPICFGVLRLLRVLDALSIRFYEFPEEVLQLILLRYMSLTCNGNLPPSISKLWNLQCLIVQKHQSIKFSLAESYLPVEIWDLQELQYLEVMGRNLPDPPPKASLPKLSTLLDVDVHTCTKSVLQSIPELEKLRVQVELEPDAAEVLSCFDYISHPPNLKSLKCSVKNPKIAAPPRLRDFLSSLKKLTLRGFGFPWEEMNKFAGLIYLKVLKLQCFAFRVAKWEAKKKFSKLKYLLIEDTDLIQWTSEDETFPSLRFITLQNCYKLREIPDISTLREINLDDCNPAVVTCANQRQSFRCKVSVSCSWDEGNRKA